MAKRALCLVFALMFSINIFAAAVSDNDGSAFITKAEFDSLKNDFQQQLDLYNTSIDNKVDDAIASYISGIKIERNKDIEPYISNYGDIRWMHGPYMYFTNRRFTEYSTTAGRYVDTTAWQIINPENRRGYVSDGYLWFHDYLTMHSSSFTMAGVTFMLHPHDVPWGWGCHDGRTTASRGPSIFVAMKKEATNWALYASDGGLQSEQGHISYLYTRPHKVYGMTYPNSNDPFGGVNDTTWLQDYYSDTMSIQQNASTTGEIANYTIQNIKYGNTTTQNEDGTIQSIILQKWNPSFIQTRSINLWANGDDGYPLKVACGAESYCGDYWSRVGDGKTQDNRWQTQTQFECDMDNLIYGVWGTDVSGDTNVAPPIAHADFDYIDLSESPNYVEVPFKIKSLGLSVQHDILNYSNNELGHFQSSSLTPAGDLTLKVPLFYRVKWADMYSGEFKYKGNSLCKSDGYPVIVNAQNKGNVKLKITYEEKASTDTSVISLTPDHKIKTYFKNKPFTDSSSEYIKGYTNVDGTGTLVNLNGTEWTTKQITVNIPVEKGGSVWMRIDPLTSDGIYCSMTDYSCTLVTE